MIVWRLSQDWMGVFEGACISDEKYKKVYYADKILYEPVTDFGRDDWIEIEEKPYCEAKGLECLLFFDSGEVDLFYKKLKHVTDSN